MRSAIYLMFGTLLLAGLLAGCAGSGAPRSTARAPLPCYDESHRPADVYSQNQVEHSYRPGAAAGSAVAQYNLANALLLGAGAPRNESEAAIWYQAAVDRGHAPAAYYLAALYETGRGVDQDWSRARQLFEQSAEAGDVKAAECLARYYAGIAGTGETDSWRSALWFEIAAKARHREDPAYRSVKSRLSADQIAQARTQALKWRPTPMTIRVAEVPVSPIEVVPQIKPVRAGSGVRIGGNYVLTNAHVVVGCNQIGVIDFNGNKRSAAITAVDLSDDIAVLQSLATGMVPRLLAANDPMVGSAVMVIGYPLSDLLGNQTARTWRGVISELSGPDGNAGLLRMTAPILQGSSGGPVLDDRGRLVGIVIGTVDPTKIASTQPVSLGGISYAVKSTRIRWLLDRQGLSYLLGDPSGADGGASLTGGDPILSPSELAELGQRTTVYVECRE
ncbi:MAG: trypsin-like peptidase domain-containing protein [Dongiaceae bacterium]